LKALFWTVLMMLRYDEFAPRPHPAEKIRKNRQKINEKSGKFVGISAVDRIRNQRKLNGEKLSGNLSEN
jgi:hypothetical protein